jgi:cysteinyl-tRNA synthetase
MKILVKIDGERCKREGISVWDIANKYIKQFTESMDLLGITKPDVLCRATDNISEQIALNQLIEKNGFTYLTKKGLVYDTGKFSDYAKFGNLNLDELKSRDDVEIDTDKKNPWDFFLWAINPDHLMKWKSPWAEGYPGWHIECTAMSTKYLGNNFDIHTEESNTLRFIILMKLHKAMQLLAKDCNYWLHNVG